MGNIIKFFTIPLPFMSGINDGTAFTGFSPKAYLAKAGIISYIIPRSKERGNSMLMEPKRKIKFYQRLTFI
jgi:hypothetical protein